MDIFDSQWLIKMLDKSSKNPRERILNLFVILEDWLDAPDINLHISSKPTSNLTLISYLTAQSQILGASNPSILAEHIILIARSAAIRASEEPNSGHLTHAKKAAEALILAQTQDEYPKANNTKSTYWGMAASVIILLSISALWVPKIINPTPTKTAHNISSVIVVTPAKIKTGKDKLTAQDAATMYAKFEQMRNGTCQFPEAIQIPDKDKAVYIESVVGGKLPTDLADLAIANTYLEKVRCNYTPMLMANSK